MITFLILKKIERDLLQITFHVISILKENSESRGNDLNHTKLHI